VFVTKSVTNVIYKTIYKDAPFPLLKSNYNHIRLDAEQKERLFDSINYNLMHK